MNHLIIVDIDNVHLRYKNLLKKMPHVFKVGVGVNVANVKEHECLLDKLINVEVYQGKAIADLADDLIICELGKCISKNKRIHGAGIISGDKRLVASFKKICDIHEITFINFTKYIDPKYQPLPRVLKKFQEYTIQKKGVPVVRRGKTKDLATAITSTLQSSNEGAFRKVGNHKLEIAKCIIETFCNEASRGEAFVKHLGLTRDQAKALLGKLENLNLRANCRFDASEKLPIGNSRVRSYIMTLRNIAQDVTADI
tara:strand:- start:7507 stop:8271 length:765 start_codon:yes stop_codon:yes gene_type:complete